MISQWFECVGVTWPHVALVINASNERAQFSGTAGVIDMQDSLYFLFPRFKTSWSKPVTKPISFFDGHSHFNGLMMYRH
jgi:hypothetical protein